MFDTIENGGLEARRVERFDTSWLYLMKPDAQRFAIRHLDNLWKLEAESEEMWLVLDGTVPIFFVGVIPYTYLGVDKYIWTLPFAGLSVKHMKAIKRMVDEQAHRFPVCVAQVVMGHSIGERFAEFMGFEREYEVGDFTVYVRRN